MDWVTPLLSGAVGAVLGGGGVGAVVSYKLTQRLNRQMQGQQVRLQHADQTGTRLDGLVRAVSQLRVAVRAGAIDEDSYGQAQSAYDDARAFPPLPDVMEVMQPFRELLDAADNFAQARNAAEMQLAAELITELGEAVILAIADYRRREGLPSSL